MTRDPLARSMRPRGTFCYGAKSCLVGRAYIYGFGAGGQRTSLGQSTLFARSLMSAWRSPASKASRNSVDTIWCASDLPVILWR